MEELAALMEGMTIAGEATVSASVSPHSVLALCISKLVDSLIVNASSNPNSIAISEPAAYVTPSFSIS